MKLENLIKKKGGGKASYKTKNTIHNTIYEPIRSFYIQKKEHKSMTEKKKKILMNSTY